MGYFQLENNLAIQIMRLKNWVLLLTSVSLWRSAPSASLGDSQSFRQPEGLGNAITIHKCALCKQRWEKRTRKFVIESVPSVRRCDVYWAEVNIRLVKPWSRSSQCSLGNQSEACSKFEGQGAGGKAQSAPTVGSASTSSGGGRHAGNFLPPLFSSWALRS